MTMQNRQKSNAKRNEIQNAEFLKTQTKLDVSLSHNAYHALWFIECIGTVHSQKHSPQNTPTAFIESYVHSQKHSPQNTLNTPTAFIESYVQSQKHSPKNTLNTPTAFIESYVADKPP